MSALVLSVVLLPLLPLLAQETIPLRADVTAPDAEKVEDRGKGGIKDRSLSNVSRPSLTVYLPPKDKATGQAIVICPGGGYEHLAIDKEGHEVARWLNQLGVAGIVLKYRLPAPGAMHGVHELRAAAQAARVSVDDAEEAIRVVRSNAARWNLKADGIGMMGFSAGGHLAAMVAMLAPAKLRPDFLTLVYAGLPAQLELSPASPRTFLVHAADDDKVNVADTSIRMFLALRENKVPAELHVYPTGGHGFGIRKSDKASAAWPAVYAAWLAHL
jgi:acetyl esterase/lipase